MSKKKKKIHDKKDKNNNERKSDVCLCVGVLKRLEEEDLDEGVRRRLKDSSETPGALWHIYLNKDMDKVRDFLHQVSVLTTILSNCDSFK